MQQGNAAAAFHMQASAYRDNRAKAMRYTTQKVLPKLKILGTDTFLANVSPLVILSLLAEKQKEAVTPVVIVTPSDCYP